MPAYCENFLVTRMRRVGQTRDPALRVRIPTKALPMRNTIQQSVPLAWAQVNQGRLIGISLGWESEVPATAGVAVLATLPDRGAVYR
jgi:hypothetical protein